MHPKNQEESVWARLLADIEAREGLYALLYFDLKKYVGTPDKIQVDELNDYVREVLMMDTEKIEINKDFSFDDKPRAIISAILPKSKVLNTRKHYHALFRSNSTGACGRTGALEDEEYLGNEFPFAFQLGNNIIGSEFIVSLMSCTMKCDTASVLTKDADQESDKCKIIAESSMTLDSNDHVSTKVISFIPRNKGLKKCPPKLMVRIRIGVQHPLVINENEVLEFATLLQVLLLMKSNRGLTRNDDISISSLLTPKAKLIANQFFIHQNLTSMEALVVRFCAWVHFYSLTRSSDDQEKVLASSEERDRFFEVASLAVCTIKRITDVGKWPKSAKLMFSQALSEIGELAFWRILPNTFSYVVNDFDKRHTRLQKLFLELEEYLTDIADANLSITSTFDRLFDEWNMERDAQRHLASFMRTVALVVALTGLAIEHEDPNDVILIGRHLTERIKMAISPLVKPNFTLETLKRENTLIQFETLLGAMADINKYGHNYQYKKCRDLSYESFKDLVDDQLVLAWLDHTCREIVVAIKSSRCASEFERVMSDASKRLAIVYMWPSKTVEDQVTIALSTITKRASLTVMAKFARSKSDSDKQSAFNGLKVAAHMLDEFGLDKTDRLKLDYDKIKSLFKMYDYCFDPTSLKSLQSDTSSNGLQV